MAKGDALPSHEDVVRALYFPHWQPGLRRAVSSAFTQQDASVSRLAILPYQDVVDIFKQEFLNVEVVATFTVGVGQIVEACSDSPTISVNVVEDPVLAGDGVRIDNPAHAEIRGRVTADRTIPAPLTRAMAKRILNAGVTREL